MNKATKRQRSVALLRRVAAACLVLALAAAPWSTARAAIQRGEAVVVMDAVTGKVVEEKATDRTMGPASLAKMMTLYLLYKAVAEGYASWDDEALVSKRAYRKEGSTMFLRQGSRVPLRKLAYGIGVVSGNDACIAVAEHLSGSEVEFVKSMNEEAQRMGLTDTHFGTATGLPVRGQVTSARDMAKLARELISDYPDVIEILSAKQLTYEGVTQKNRNGLLWRDIGVDGVKTGHTEVNGFHMVASATKDSQRFIAVVMGARSQSAREAIAQRHLMAAFRTFATVMPVAPDAPVAAAKVWKGQVDTLQAVPAEVDYITVRRGDEDNLTVVSDVPEQVAPIRKGQKVGTATVLLGDEVVEKLDLVAADDVKEAGFLARLWDSILMALHSLLDKLF